MSPCDIGLTLTVTVITLGVGREWGVGVGSGERDDRLSRAITGRSPDILLWSIGHSNPSGIWHDTSLAALHGLTRTLRSIIIFQQTASCNLTITKQ